MLEIVALKQLYSRLRNTHCLCHLPPCLAPPVCIPVGEQGLKAPGDSSTLLYFCSEHREKSYALLPECSSANRDVTPFKVNGQKRQRTPPCMGRHSQIRFFVCLAQISAATLKCRAEDVTGSGSGMILLMSSKKYQTFSPSNFIEGT